MANVDDIQHRSARSVKWVGIAELVVRLIQFGTSLVLARLLLPEDFGVMSLVFVFMNLAYVVFDFGFTSALIQHKDVTEEHLATTFVTYVFGGMVFVGLVLMGAPVIAHFFGVLQLSPMLRVLSLIFVFYTFSALPKVLLMRELQFHRLSRFQMVGAVGYASVAISVALGGGGAWCFVFAALTEQLLVTLLAIWATHWRPRWQFSMAVFRELFQFGGSVLATRLVGYLNTNLPQIIIGRVLGTTILGYYALAYQLIDLPVQRISKNVLKVMFPAFSKLQDQPIAYRHMYQQTVYFLALVTFPIFVGLFLLAPELVPFLYGEKWLPAVLPLQALALLGLMRSLWTTTSVVFLSKGKPQIELKLQVILLIVLPPILFWSAQVQFNTLLVALVMLYALLLLGGIHQALRLVLIPPLQYIKIYSLPVGASLVFVVLGELVRLIPGITQYRVITILLIALIGGGMYLLITLRSDKTLFQKIGKFIAA